MWALSLPSDNDVDALTELQIHTFLPASDKAFNTGVEEPQGHLRAAFQGNWPEYSSFAGRVLGAQIFHRVLEHSFNQINELGGRGQMSTFWDQHKAIDDELTLILAFLPSELRLPEHSWDHNALFVNIMLHTAVICLHRAGLGYSGQPPPHELLLSQSQERLVPAAKEIVSVFQMMSNLQAALRNPLIIFAAYVASIVFLEDFFP